ncbi:hypothetical protein SAY86_014055 [Trapa natans]|uniref:Uncharacterized protein n=1 Tax=Trapa natans TaxID=22666 RepID=A0AAN7QR16_TRANT|nr:hypothetical protein SAY86_014055 [Trapa natans]
MEWVAERNRDMSPPLQAKRKYQHRKKEFVGWGSRELIDFLESVGRDTSHLISQDDAADIITEYIHDHKLTAPDRRKQVNCDARLISLFGKKKLVKFNRIKIYTLLSAHYAREEKTSDDDFLSSSEDEEMAAKRSRITIRRKPPNNRVLKVSTSPYAAIVPDNLKLVYLKRSLVEDLLKYLDTFEQKVMGSFVRVKSDPNDYLQKNPYQLLQVIGIRNVSKGANASKEVLLRVHIRDIHISTLSDDNFTEEECEELCQKMKTGMYERLTLVELEKKVQVLHEDITKHRIAREIALLQGLIERANEKGWRKELAEYLERKQLLQTATEQSRMLCEVPRVIPEQIKDDSTPLIEKDDSAAEDFFSEDDIVSLTSSESALGDSPSPEIAKSMSNGDASSSMMDFSGHGKQLLEKIGTDEEGHMGMELNFAETSKGTSSRLQEASQMIDFSCIELSKTGLNAASDGTKDLLAKKVISSAEYCCGPVVQESQTKNTIEDTVKDRKSPAIMDLSKGFDGARNTSQVIDSSPVVAERNRFSGSSNRVKALTNIAMGTNSTEHVHGSGAQENPQKQNQQEQTNSSHRQRPSAMDLNFGVAVTTTEKNVKATAKGTSEKKVETDVQVIDISSDDEDDTVRPPDPQGGNNNSSSKNSSELNIRSMVWYYRDPSGCRQGPFSLEMLKQWSNAHYFPPDFKVWMAGQDPNQARLLTSVLRCMLPFC